MTDPNKAGAAGQAAALPDASEAGAAPAAAVRAADTPQNDTHDTANAPNGRGDAAVALPPLALLRELDRWLDNTGHDDCHPWRLSILSTLAAHGGDANPADAQEVRWQRSIGEGLQAHSRRQRVDAGEVVEALLLSIADHAAGLLELIDAQDKIPLRLPLRASVGHIGWVADLLLDRALYGQARGGAAAWLLQEHEAAALTADRGAA